MSAFLGPIHFWLYRKIQIQGKMVEAIIQWNEKEKLVPFHLGTILDERYGPSENRPLEQIINESDIHGWLQQQVSLVERKLADAVTMVKKQDQSIFCKLEMTMEQVGEAFALEGTIALPELYKKINDHLLDGMPCDHANMLLVENNNEVTWKRVVCVHSEYWEEVGGSVVDYYKLREAFVKGLLSKENAEIKKIDENTFSLKRV